MKEPRTKILAHALLFFQFMHLSGGLSIPRKSSFFAVTPAPKTALSSFDEVEPPEDGVWVAVYEEEETSATAPLALRAAFNVAMERATTINNDECNTDMTRKIKQPVAAARLRSKSGMLDRIRSLVPKEQIEDNHAAVLTAVDAAVHEWLIHIRSERERGGKELYFENLRCSADMYVGPMLKSRGFVDLDIDNEQLDFAALAKLGRNSGSIPSQRAHLGLAIECYKAVLESTVPAIVSGATVTTSAAIITNNDAEKSSESTRNLATSGSVTSAHARNTCVEILRMLKEEPATIGTATDSRISNEPPWVSSDAWAGSKIH